MPVVEIEYQGNIYRSVSAQRKIAVIRMTNMCKEYSIDPRFISGRDRRQSLVDIRAKIARRLINMGFSLLTVSYALNKNHATIAHYKDKRYDHLGVQLNEK